MKLLAGLLILVSLTTSAEPSNPRARRPSDFRYIPPETWDFSTARSRELGHPSWLNIGRGSDVTDVEVFLDDRDRMKIRFQTPKGPVERRLVRGHYQSFEITADGLRLTPKRTHLLASLTTTTFVREITIENDPASPKVLASIVVGTALAGRVLVEQWVPGVVVGGTLACGWMLTATVLDGKLPVDHWVVKTSR